MKLNKEYLHSRFPQTQVLSHFPPTLYFLLVVARPPRKPKVMGSSWSPGLLTNSELLGLSPEEKSRKVDGLGSLFPGAFSSSSLRRITQVFLVSPYSDLRKNFSPLGIFNFLKQNIQSIKKKQIPHSMTAEN